MSFSDWLFSDIERPESAHGQGDKSKHPWWHVMCLTGVDYFSTLGYQSGIAFLAAGVLSPVATLVLVMVTLFAALPVYNRVAAASPYGQGSIAMLEKLFPGWTGKVFVLVLLGFATTDFIITMTLSAADAAAHFIHNPYTPHSLQNQMAVTLVLLAILGAIFLKGFKEAINIAVILVGVYLALNLIVSAVGVFHVLEQPRVLLDWKRALFTQHGSLLSILGLSCLLFPRLALGLSGFETGVAVMPLIECDNLDLRIRNTRRLLATAALIMSFFLMATSFITTLLIPAVDFKEGGPANGRAVAYLAHQYLGGAFRLPLRHKHDSHSRLRGSLGHGRPSESHPALPSRLRYGAGVGSRLAPTRAGLCFYRIPGYPALSCERGCPGRSLRYGVLVLITSASCAVTIAARTWVARAALGLVSLIFIYTTLVNIYERPEGLKISCIFIFCMIFSSLVSRAFRSTELRITGIELDPQAEALLAESAHKTIRLIAWNPRNASGKNREQAKIDLRELHGLSHEACIYFVEVERGDTSDFTETLRIQGWREGDSRILHARSAVVANSIAALLIHLKETTGCIPHVYFHWTDVSPVVNVTRVSSSSERAIPPP